MRFKIDWKIVFVFVLVLALVCVLTRFLVGEQPEPHNGFWWNKTPDSFKTGYITGWSEAFEMSLKIFNPLMYAPFWQDSTEGDSHKDILEYRIDCYHRILSIHQISDSQIEFLIHGLNKIYEDERNKKISLLGAKKIVFMKLEGKPKKEIQNELRELREIYKKFE